MKHSIGIDIPANTLTEMFTVPNGYVADVSMVFVTNNGTGNKHVSVYWQHEHDSNHKIYILKEATVNAKTYVQFTNGSVVFKSGDSMKVLTEAGATVAVIVTFDLRKEPPLYTFPNE
jgi:type III secretory pathway lipoprotein EscJ